MVLSAITTYPDLWAAAVDLVGIANFVTFLENTGPWRRKLREAEQIVAALRSRNVPVEYMRFEDEGHGLVKRANRLVAYPAIARFLDYYTGHA